MEVKLAFRAEKKRSWDILKVIREFGLLSDVMSPVNLLMLLRFLLQRGWFLFT